MARTGAATIFALALLCSGQSASLVATVGGQIVSEGFIRWRVSVSISSDRSVIAYLLRILSISASHAAPPHATIGPHPLHDCGSVSGAGGDQCDARRFAGRPLLRAPIYRFPTRLAHILAYRDAGVFPSANAACTD